MMRLPNITTCACWRRRWQQRTLSLYALPFYWREGWPGGSPFATGGVTYYLRSEFIISGSVQYSCTVSVEPATFGKVTKSGSYPVGLVLPEASNKIDAETGFVRNQFGVDTPYICKWYDELSPSEIEDMIEAKFDATSGAVEWDLYDNEDGTVPIVPPIGDYGFYAGYVPYSVSLPSTLNWHSLQTGQNAFYAGELIMRRVSAQDPGANIMIQLRDLEGQYLRTTDGAVISCENQALPCRGLLEVDAPEFGQYGYARIGEVCA